MNLDKYYKNGNYKMSKLLNESTLSKFVIRKWMERSNLSSSRYSVNNNIRFKATMLRSTLCNYNVACNVLKE